MFGDVFKSGSSYNPVMIAGTVDSLYWKDGDDQD